jgi:hypothetical protein
MNFNLWTARLSVAFKIIVGFLAGEWSQLRVKKEVAASVFIKTIKYYENTNCTLKKGKKKSAQLSCVEVLHVNVGFFFRRNICYGLYFNKFHAICKGKFQKCDHIYLTIHSHSALWI